jgi:hypothetical protein
VYNDAKGGAGNMTAIKNKEDAIRRLSPVFERNKTRKAILFGSYANGTQTSNSDIDILVDSGLHGLKFYGLLEDVCEAVNVPVDLIDVYQVEKGSEFEAEVSKTGVVIYERT